MHKGEMIPRRHFREKLVELKLLVNINILTVTTYIKKSTVDVPEVDYPSEILSFIRNLNEI